jgi:hypothetical protein
MNPETVVSGSISNGFPFAVTVTKPPRARYADRSDTRAPAAGPGRAQSSHTGS